ncbi:MAG: DNA repair protein RadA [Ethanoligenens sp.]
MAKARTQYVCSKCGHVESKWVGRCPACNEWNTLEEMAAAADRASTRTSAPMSRSMASASRLSQVETSNSDRLVTRIQEFNRVMGGGLIRDSLTVLSSPPGCGKSSLALMIAQDLAQQGYKALYASGEESASQIKHRADRILAGISDNLWILSDTSMNNVLRHIDAIDADFIVTDSIQTFVMDGLDSRPGSPTQTMQCASELLYTAKNPARPRAVVMIGQMTKENELAGLRALEHMVDTVLLMDSNTGEEIRSLYCSKNRFGSTGEMGFFSMTESGLVSIDNPSAYFMTKREEGESISGSALTVVREGSRPIIVEIESLVSRSFTPYPTRIGESLKRDQLNTLVSILEQRAEITLFDKNVILKTTGGLRLSENAVSLCVIMSIVSSVFHKGIPGDTLFIADVGLTGELKKVPSLESRVKEADRMGFRRVFLAKDAALHTQEQLAIQVNRCKTVKQVITAVFS